MYIRLSKDRWLQSWFRIEMKTFIVVCALFILAQAEITEEQKKRLEKYSKECLEVSKVEDSILKEAEKGEFPDDAKLRVHILCVSKKLNLINDKGEIQSDYIMERLSSQIKNKEEVENLVKLCLVQKDTAENTACEMGKCLKKNLPKDVSLL